MTAAEHIVLVFTGGEREAPSSIADLPADAFVIAADSGVDHALALGRPVDLAVGDFDSVSVEGLARVEAAGTRIERHPAAKDETDLELALACALERGAARIVVVGGHGGRVDHFLGNVAVLAADRYAAVPIEARMGGARIHVVRSLVELHGAPGDLVTLLAFGGPATGITTSGLRYPLAGETLHPGSSRGVSNEHVEPIARVEVGGGVLLAVQPGERGISVTDS